MVDIKLPPEIQELVDSCDDNCREIENQAVGILRSIEHPLFNFLRDLTAQKSYFVLSRLRDWFGITPTKEHCLCLMMLTDYISCAYNNTDFYGTFVKEKQDKFYGSFFAKLFGEWKVLFYKMPITVLPMDQFVSLKNSLRVSIARFSSGFAYKVLLTEIMTSCEEYGSRLEKHLSELKAQQKFNIGVDILKNSVPVLSSKSNTITVTRVASDLKSSSISVPFKVNPPKIPSPILNFVQPGDVRVISDSKSSSISVPYKVNPITTSAAIQNYFKSTTAVRVISDSKPTSISVPSKVNVIPPKTPTAIYNVVENHLAKRQSLPSIQLTQEPKKVDFNATLFKKEVKQPPVIVIDDSPVKTERTSLTLDNITNTLSSKALKRPAEFCVGLKPLNLDGKQMKFQNDVTVSNNVTRDSPQQKLNAFDILMRRKSIKIVS